MYVRKSDLTSLKKCWHRPAAVFFNQADKVCFGYEIARAGKKVEPPSTKYSNRGEKNSPVAGKLFLH
jgi:hypothetical protein